MVKRLVADLARGLAHDLISGVRDGVAWGLFAVALGGVNLSFRRRRPTVYVAHQSSPPWDSVATRTALRRAELIHRGRL